MIYEVYYIENIGIQPVTIYVEDRINSPIFQSPSGDQVTIMVGDHITVENDRVDIMQIRNMQKLRMIRSTLKTQQVPGVRFAQIIVDFGDGEYVNPNPENWGGERVPFIENDIARTTISDNMVLSTNTFVCTVSGDETEDHSGEDGIIERITAYVTNVQPGIGYEVIASAQNNSWGKYKINVMIGG